LAAQAMTLLSFSLSLTAECLSGIHKMSFNTSIEERHFGIINNYIYKYWLTKQ
jgi:hypothetical protein